MSRRGPRGRAQVGDLLALEIQKLHGEKKLRGDQPLLRIDNRDEAARAPYQFDTVRGRLHRRGCRSIPPSSRTALHGVWRFGSEEEKFACPQCKPVPRDEKSADQSLAADLLYGFLSILDQFGGVLRERGREYRSSQQGRQLRVDLEGLYATFGDREKEVLSVVLSSLDGILQTVQDLNHSLNGSNGHNGGPPEE